MGKLWLLAGLALLVVGALLRASHQVCYGSFSIERQWMHVLFWLVSSFCLAIGIQKTLDQSGKWLFLYFPFALISVSLTVSLLIRIIWRIKSALN